MAMNKVLVESNKEMHTSFVGSECDKKVRPFAITLFRSV